MARGERAEHNRSEEGLVVVFVAEARSWNEISRSAKNQCWFGGKFSGDVVLRLGKRAEPAKTRLDGWLFFSSI